MEISLWFQVEAVRIYGVLNQRSEEEQQEALLAKIRSTGGLVTVRDWMRSRSKKTVQAAEQELQLLVDQGLGVWETSRGPGRPSKRFRLVE